MDLLDDPAFKNKYQKNKLRVKRWENEFKEKYGRRPNKDDIRAADNTIKESYKMYYKLKTQALEETLLDITFPDESQANVTANTSSEISSNISSLQDSMILEKTLSPETSLKNSENIDPEKTENTILSPKHAKETLSSSVNAEETSNIDGVWGSHLNKDNDELKPTKKRNLIIGRSTSFQLSQKMFSSSNLTKRNPRKSLSMNKLKNNKSDICPNEIVTETNNDGFDIEPSKSMFADSLRIIQGKTKITSQPINAIQQLIKGGTTTMTLNRNLNHGWLERCARDNNFEPVTYNPQRLSGTSDSGIESMDTSDPPIIENFHPPIVDKIQDFTDSEDFICNSDSEDERRKKRVRNFKKTLSDVSCQQLSKRQCLVDTDDNFSFSQPLPDKASVVSSFMDNQKLTIEENGNFVDDPSKRINDKTNESIVEKLSISSLQIDNKRLSGKKIEFDTREEESSDDEKKTKKKKKTQTKRTRKITRVTRSTRSKSKLDEPKTSEQKIVTKKRSMRTKKIGNIDESLDNETIEETLEIPNIPIYGIEATQVVPRFPMPRNTSGDLVNDCSLSVGTKIATEKIISIAKTRATLTAREKLEAKVASGRVNENFVRINIKKKVFVRGKRNFSYSKYRKNQWKQRKNELSSSDGALDLADFVEKNGGACFKCGDMGHSSRRCTAAKSQDLLPKLDDDEEEPSDFLTLEEVEKMAAKTAFLAHSTRIDKLPKCPSFLQTDEATNRRETTAEKQEETSKINDIDEENYEELFDGDFDEEMIETQVNPSSRLKGHKIPKELLAKLLPPESCIVEPVFTTLSNDNIIETPAEIFQALKMFGHENFRPGQEKAIMRILSGQSTLVTLSTGSGKSLCYQLPAYVYSKRGKCITLVVSPLVSLMDDQVTGVPKFLSAAALHTGQTPKVREQIMQTIRDGKLDVLLVSPEAVVAGEKSTGFGALLRQLPPIAFACIDEAHCISQWSHNFRPSYLMVCRVLMEKLGVKTILGLTATATKHTAESIVRHLAIHDGMSGVISDTPMPKNLTLTVSKDEQRDRALVELVVSERFKDCDSIIVYCTRREECTRIAGVLRLSLQDPKYQKDPKAKCSPYAEAYHAGLTASRRKIIQKSFMSGQTRIVVATVAFGMGINKADIRSVIHYNMPASFEGYVQEVGRAGRDNLPAHCHLFLSPSQNADKLELRRHIFANGVDRHMIRRLLQKIFVPCSCPRVEGQTREKRCPGHEVAIPIDETVRALDITEETISTLLCYLELHPKRFITVLSSVYVNAKVSSYAGPRALKMAAQTSPPLAMAIALDLKKGISHEKSTVVGFPVVDIAAAIGWDSGVVKSHLKNLEWQTVDGKSKRSTITVLYDTLGIRVRAPGDLTDIELDEALEALAERARTQETSALQQLETIHASLNKFSVKSVKSCMELNDENTSKSESLKEIIREYFRSDTPLSIVEISPQNPCSNEAEITSDVRGLISSYRDNNFTGRAVARIFHGIQSPNYSALTWSRCRFWRSHLSTDFNFICRIATREILAMR